ncbi:MAG: sulfide/dihydroorotate dehydrogenase-like FAD/NAD-binding protein [Candidatus Omnitrophica bacterium]|nr:sulfide/dihydroorotate dehydrogenase-like FAD/NAD-binding protein [Candidatus Omnitrophota bacterium]
MYKIIHKQVIAQDIKKIDITAPVIASRALPGQFVMVTPVLGEHNIPMAIVDSDERRSVISLIVHEVGPATRKLGDLSIGESLYQMVGPLGRAAQMDKYGLVICVATGIGAAQILPVCRGLKKKGNKVIGIVGAKSKKVLMLESQMRVVCDEVFITTNDGSYERRGLASDLLKELLNRYTVHRVYAIGSVEMMQAAARMTKAKNIPLRVTLNPYMVNGLGLCGSCRVKIDGKHLLACTDGPEFDGHMVDYQDLSQRMNALESRSWENQPHPIVPRRPGFAALVKSLWVSAKK